MNTSVRTKKQATAALEEEQLKHKLELYRSASKPQKSILKPSGNLPIALSAGRKGSLTGPDVYALPDPPITPKFTASHSTTASKSRGRPAEPCAVAAESHTHLQIILQKLMTVANSLANTGKIQEVICGNCVSECPSLTRCRPFKPSIK